MSRRSIIVIESIESTMIILIISGSTDLDENIQIVINNIAVRKTRLMIYALIYVYFLKIINKVIFTRILIISLYS